MPISKSKKSQKKIKQKGGNTLLVCPSDITSPAGYYEQIMGRGDAPIGEAATSTVEFADIDGFIYAIFGEDESKKKNLRTFLETPHNVQEIYNEIVRLRTEAFPAYKDKGEDTDGAKGGAKIKTGLKKGLKKGSKKVLKKNSKKDIAKKVSKKVSKSMKGGVKRRSSKKVSKKASKKVSKSMKGGVKRRSSKKASKKTSRK